MKLTPPYTQDVRLYTLTYTFVKANGRHQHKLKAFVGVIQQLSEMHSAGFVPGDIRLATMVFSGDNDSHLIDFSVQHSYVEWAGAVHFTRRASQEKEASRKNINTNKELSGFYNTEIPCTAGQKRKEKK